MRNQAVAPSAVSRGIGWNDTSHLPIELEFHVRVREEAGLPGMAVLQFAFGDTAANPYLPHNVLPNSVIYPGTHDNDTTLGWYGTVDEKAKDHARRYLRVTGEAIGWDFIRAAYGAVSGLAIIPLHDLLSLGSAARFNFPGRPTGNWQWRYRENQLDGLLGETANYLRALSELYGRTPVCASPPPAA